jgi:hypothetical protein
MKLMKITTVIKTTAFCTLSLLLPLMGALFFSSCNQDDIFYQIEYETELREPLIKGGPSKIVEFKEALYVASGRIWTYPKGGGWKGMSEQPPGIKVLDIAATSGTSGYLYAVTSHGVDLSDSGYYRYPKDASSGDFSWERIDGPPPHPNPTAIYGAGDALFAGAASGGNNAVYALKDDDTDGFKPITPDSSETGRLLGAVQWDGRYFFSLEDQGVFTVTKLDGTKSPDSVPGSAGKGNFTGFIVVDGRLLMVSESGVICQLTAGQTSITEANSLGFDFTGAIAVWNDPGRDENKRLLLLGRKGSNLNYSGYGYYECPIPSGFKITELGVMEPQVTVEKNATYKNSLGKRAINSIYQAPFDIDSSMPIFASTQAYNLWACRDGVWNYE